MGYGAGGVLVALLLLVGACAGPPPQERVSTRPVESRTALLRLFPRAEECRSCHLQHYQEWSQSMHARSLTTPGVRGNLQNYLPEVRQKKGRVNRSDLMACFRCHAPALQWASDQVVAEVAEAVAQGRGEALAGLEVTCSICHSMRDGEVHPMGQTRTAYGPIRDPASNPYHSSTYSAGHATGQFCQRCHEWVPPNPPNVPCTMVYNDWAKSHAAQAGVACQSCHMDPRMGVAARGGPLRQVHGHLMPGGHHEGMLKRAVELDLVPTREGEQVRVAVGVRNLAPHRVPDS
ncbi:MAG: hypothetical protein HYV08_13135 [Deltaproteobacteria bacterium]|nr:hypothetical protein [Deltaproteobacteria bacterium]